jgi:hypothetical protein
MTLQQAIGSSLDNASFSATVVLPFAVLSLASHQLAYWEFSPIS